MYLQEREYLLTNDARNKYIKEWVLKACKGNTLIPVDWDFQEEEIVNTFKDCGRKVIVINGKTPQEKRDTYYQQMEHENDTILIVKTGVMREGISINNLTYMVGYYLQKSYTRIIQLIGRIERHGGGNVPILFDFYDDTRVCQKHYAERRKFYKEEEIPLIEKEVKLQYSPQI